ncbi:MAG: methyltransferase domain-containing protein [Pseudomonadota bacterium]
MGKPYSKSGGLKPELWTERSVDETQQMYDDWASSYDADVDTRGYRTPGRIAKALAAALPEDERPVLDYGCGTGLGGAALRAAGIDTVHGTDINQAMLDEAHPKGIYRKLWLGTPGTPPAPPGIYRAIVATGVISLGAAPPEALVQLVDALAEGDLLALSFNDPTLAHGGFDAILQAECDSGRLSVVSRAHGPHLDDVGMGSDVIVARRGPAP